MRESKLPPSNDGFTLIEILVAISILAISLVVILQLFSGGLKSSRLSNEYTKVIFHAREKMGEILLSKDLSEGETEGEFANSFRWRCLVERIESGEEDEEKLPFNMFNIRVDIIWDVGDREKHFQVSTMKMIAKKKDDESMN
ncbi:MAG: prepilin-type N-terminal cleavage/methylation domain-containing protein [Desulfobacteraceae bacterium]|nr:prepilin-type N-terminal cleavage/methylation domain-containing protein [Deltaproteobacteria bacterium]MBL6978297.1 prepilin-type N-terminal cleavage/methylation domain-containing protein [Desulfobacteraceae bacterium]MBL7217224.1 prepilin-type N-terminal cleavage/methylation domain-containing protein [Desulfobacteraceae bacterium]